jgi:hypothetical protein
MINKNTILEVEIKNNKIEVIVFSREKHTVNKIEELKITQTVVKKKAKKNSVVKELLTIAYKQIVTTKPKDTKVYITLSALETMKGYGLSEEKVTDAVLHGEYIQGKENMISRKYNGYEVGAIAKYNNVTKTYVVLTAWKRNRR